MPGSRFAPSPGFAMAPDDRGAAAVATPAGDPQRDRKVTGDAATDGTPTDHAGEASTPAAASRKVPDSAADRPGNKSPNEVAARPRASDAAAENLAKAFPDNWRHDMAGGDKSFLKTLDRFESPAALAKAYRELTARLSSGELRATRGPGDKATPEQIAAWRAEQGLPESAAAYVDGLTSATGDVMGEAEKPLLASFAEQAMKGHWTRAQYDQAVGWYFALQDRILARRQQADADFKQLAASDLMREWGADYAANRNAVGQFFDKTFPQQLKQHLLNARLPDGTILANHPAFNRAILEVAKTIDPRGATLPNAAGTGLSNVESRIAEIEGKYMRASHGSDPWKTYWSGETGARMQQEYRGLLAARERARR